VKNWLEGDGLSFVNIGSDLVYAAGTLYALADEEEAWTWGRRRAEMVGDDDWRFAWTRLGSQHHDVAFVNTDEPAYTLHHLAFHFPSLDHIKTHIDHLASGGHRIEIGVNRHAVGSNVFAYFQAPDGNRIELSAEMATLDDATPTRVNPPEVDTLTAWGRVAAPETFKDGT
jgi:catechol 2,3-dioxygenase